MSVFPTSFTSEMELVFAYEKEYAMHMHETLQEAPEKRPPGQKNERVQAAQQQNSGVSWQFRTLIAVIAFGVTMLLLKVFGAF